MSRPICPTCGLPAGRALREWTTTAITAYQYVWDPAAPDGWAEDNEAEEMGSTSDVDTSYWCTSGHKFAEQDTSDPINDLLVLSAAGIIM